MQIENNRTHYICFANKYNNTDEKIGTSIFMKGIVTDNIVDLSIIDKYDEEKFKNRVIFSGEIKIDGNFSVILLTQQNLFHNIRFINHQNNFNKPRILFLKYKNLDISNSNQYLFRNLSDINIYDKSLDISNTPTNIEEVIESKKFNRLHINLNYYKSFDKTNYYKLNLNDFIDISYLSKINNNNITSTKYQIDNISCKINQDVSNIINYDEDHFKKIKYFDISTNPVKIKDINLNDNSIDYDNSKSILIYNQLYNDTKIHLKYLDQNDVEINEMRLNDISINFCVIKNIDYYSKNFGKVLLNREFLYLNSTILNEKTAICFNNYIDNNNTDISKTIFLSLGNGIFGLTQKNLFKHVKYEKNSKKIMFSDNLKNINNYSIDYFNLNNNYLIDNGYNYNYTHNIYINDDTRDVKLYDYDFANNYKIDDFSSNIYNYSFKNYLIFNEDSNVDISNNKLNLNIDLLPDGIIENFLVYNSVNQFESSNNIIYDISRESDISIKLSNSLNTSIYNFDFRYNYGEDASINYIINLLYNDKIPNGIDSDYKINYIKLELYVELTISEGNDFENVNCIFVYHDPEKTTDPSFQYPNNNIEIIRNPDIDTLTKAIVLLPGARTSTSNSTFIPAKNSSNLSRKQIQGLIGLNKIPQLLSIQPYDENFIVGRGFIQQFQITDNCKTKEQRLENKLNSIKHHSVKNIDKNSNSKKNFANLVRSVGRNKKALRCLNN